MGNSFGNVLLLIGALIIGIGMTYFASTLVKLTTQDFAIIAIVVSLSAFVALYFMAKGRGG